MVGLHRKVERIPCRYELRRQGGNLGYQIKLKAHHLIYRPCAEREGHISDQWRPNHWGIDRYWKQPSPSWRSRCA